MGSPFIRSLALSLCLGVPFMANAREYEVPVDDVAGFFARLPADATTVTFSAADVYRCNGDIVLPERQLLVIDGRGAKLLLGPNSNGFTMTITDQKAALRRTASRYAFRDFSAIEGGRKAIDLQATLGSTITNCRLVAQSEVAIDLRFCLMTRLQGVLVTNPKKQGIVVRCGDWPGASGTNSQSNSTVLEQCRVFCSASTTEAFMVLNTGGVRMLDCIAEGAAPAYDLFLSATLDGNEETQARNPVVKSFTASNFHIEHRTRTASIYVNMPPKASVELDNIYWNGPQTAPVILYVGGQLNLSDIGWWDSTFRIETRVSAPRIYVERCHNRLAIDGSKAGVLGKVGVLELARPLLGQTTLKLTYVVVRDSSY